MCGRYVLFTDEEEDDIADIVQDIQRRVNEEEDEKKLRASGEVFPTQRAPVLTARGPEGMLWGLPGYSKTAVINARAESAYEKAMFRQAMQTRRLVVPSHGFYEWRKKDGKGKEKLLFNLPGERALYMAGLYNEYGDGPRFAILTTAANDTMQSIHHRMPVILLPSEVEAYMRDAQAARAIVLRVPPALVFTAG